VRVGTWNVEYGVGEEKNRRRLRRLLDAGADIWVLTETNDALDLGSDYRSVKTIPRSSRHVRRRWTAIWTRFPLMKTVKVEDDSRTAAVVVDTPCGPLLVFGTVLPWNTDRGPSGEGRGWSEQDRVLPLQAREWARLREEHPDTPLCVAGDLNMNLGGPHYYGTRRGRETLRRGLAGAGLVCVTETDRIPAALLRHPPIDHVCLSERIAGGARVVDGWEGEDRDGVRLSDHSALMVEVRAW
jgi:endonuclease/exonuclease/phosphatase family metal-dependent hydrolase